MTIGEIIKTNDIDTYNKLMQMSRSKPKPKEIKLGDSIENLMKHDSHQRRGRRIRQVEWGG